LASHTELASPQSEALEVRPGYYFPPYITLAHSFHAPQGWAIRDRTLNQYALQYVVDGVAEYPVEGTPYTTRKGDLLIHRPGELHSILTVEDECYVCISLVFHFGDSPFPFEQLLAGRHLIGNFMNHPVEQMLSKLVHLYRQPGLESQLACQGLLLQLLGEACSAEKGSGGDKGERSKEERGFAARMVLVKNYILDRYKEDIRLNDLERVSGLSGNYIITRFTEAFGLSPMQYLIWVRVQKAKELAIQTGLSVSEIAGEVGYADVHTFGKMFKKKTGLSLSQFRATLVTKK
jgi:AraC-like DNA-binding protein